MGVRSSGDDAETFGSQGFGQHFCVGDYLLRVVAKFRLHGLAETYSLGRYDVNERTALHPGKDNFVYSLGELGFGKNHARARAAQRLVRGRSHDLRVRNWRRMRTSRHQPREVGHIHQV